MGMRNGFGASALEIRIVAPHTGDYHIQLTDRHGSEVFINTECWCGMPSFPC